MREELPNERREMASKRNKSREELPNERREMASKRNKSREELPNERREMTSKQNKNREELLEERQEMPKRVKITTPHDNVEGTVYTVLYSFIKTYLQYNMTLNFMSPLQSTQENDRETSKK
jgi:hypothetical protein